MQVTANGHVQRSAAEWGTIMARYRQSGLGMREFCQRQVEWGLSASSLAASLSAAC
jgi:hypothetical protein